jgi:uncharacterized protein
MAGDLGCEVADLLEREDLRKQVDLQRYITPSVGLPTLTDILAELARPGRDPRKEFEGPVYTDGVTKLEDLRPGMRLPGVVTNVTAFGAFVDVGVHQDGLVHVSQLADRCVQDAHQVVRVHQRVTVTVLEVDLARGRISLSMKEQRERQEKKANEKRKGERPEASRPKKPVPFNNPFGKLLKG